MPQTRQIQIPRLQYPFAPEINAHAAAAQSGTDDWVRRHGLLGERGLRTFGGAEIGYLAARTHPRVGLDELCLISDWYAWLFLRDDEGDEGYIGVRPDRLSMADGRLLEVLGGARVTGDDPALARSLAELRDRLLLRLRSNSLATSWMNRFSRAMRLHLEANLWEATNRAKAQVPDLDSYIRMRPLTGGLQIVTELLEIIEGEHLPAAARSHPGVAGMTSASHNVSCWANDIISLPKELARGEVNNLVLALQEKRGLGLQAAVDRAAAMHDAEVGRFVALEKELPSFGPAVDEQLHHYVLSLRARMRGILDWSRSSRRYNKLQSP